MLSLSAQRFALTLEVLLKPLLVLMTVIVKMVEEIALMLIHLVQALGSQFDITNYVGGGGGRSVGISRGRGLHKGG